MAKIEEKICKHCGEFYMPTHWNNKFCSVECRDNARKIQIKENNKKSNEKIKKVQIQKRCLVCHHKFKTVRSDVVTCSPFCQKIRRQEQRREYDRLKKEEEKRLAALPKPKTLSQIEAEARAMGMHYGEYVAYIERKEKKNVV
jgi:predicted nucleic acid-binding Zn ribbon protein